jgi:putative two-component system response regulator
MTAGKKIFLVDDNITNLMIGKQILKDRYQVWTMPSAHKMFEILVKIRPDIVLLDVEMPDMSGFDAIKQLKSGEYKEIPVVFVSGNAVPPGIGAELGASGCVEKPFSAEALIETIEKFT